jgi:tetratricopeptide (TPR) repeat protein
LQFEHEDLPDALSDYDKVISLYPEFVDAYRNRAEVKKAMADIKGADADNKKADEMQQMQSSASDSVKYYEGLKLMKLMSFSDDFETPKNDKNRVQYSHEDIQLQPIFSVILFPSPGNRVRVYDAKSKPHYGGTDLTIFSKTDSVDGTLMKKKFDELDTLIYRAPAVASYYADRGVIFNFLQVYDRALSDFDKAIDLDPTNALFYFNRANTRVNIMELERQASDNEDAKSKLKEISPDVLQENSYKEAINDYSKALTIDSGFCYAWYNRAAPKIALNDFNAALNDLNQAVECDSTLGEAYFNQGLLLILLHENDAACIKLSKAGELGVLESYPVIKRYCDK